MTYCVALRLDAGLVFLSDSRTNAGIDNVSTSRKMSVFEVPGERTMVLMTAGNLSIAQSVKQLISTPSTDGAPSIWEARSMYEAAQIIGNAVRLVHTREAETLEKFGIDFNVSLIFGGQVGKEKPRLFQIYSAGNFIESTNESTYFQIGEAKYGKPIIDRVINSGSSLDEAAKCALISMDSTLRSNVSVGLPLDLLLYETNALEIGHFVTIDENNQYFNMIRRSWGKQLKIVFEGIDDPIWNAADDTPANVLSTQETRHQNQPLRIVRPEAPAWHEAPHSDPAKRVQR